MLSGLLLPTFLAPLSTLSVRASFPRRVDAAEGLFVLPSVHCVVSGPWRLAGMLADVLASGFSPSTFEKVE